jgi:ribosome biogenesis GTPase
MGRSVTDHPTASQPVPLESLGWSDFFEDQREPQEADFAPMRIASIHRSRLTALSEAGSVELTLGVRANAGDFTVGDWILVAPQTQTLHRRLGRRTVMERRTEGSQTRQAAAANIDTLFIVTSCNADFNPARLERYLALANQGGTTPVLLLTKADTTDDLDKYQSQASQLQRGLEVVTVNPRLSDAADRLAPWCGTGRTVALVGSSGVGKSTLVNTLAGPGQALAQQTGGIREHDAKGRHTTTYRSLHRMAGGGWVIDTPGMRTLHLGGAAEGIETLFAEIVELAPSCRYRDCTHAHEPGCAVRVAVAEGKIEPERLIRWRKLSEENRNNTPTSIGPRGRPRAHR